MADGDGSCEVTEGLVIADGAIVTNAKLRQIAKPTVKVMDHAIGAQQLAEDQVRMIVPQVARNYLINGNFDVWQRGGWSNLVGLPTVLGTGAGHVYGADRWCLGIPQGATYRAIRRGAFAVDQTSVPNSPTYYLRWEQVQVQTTVFPILSQPIEDVRTLAGKVVTVSWWMKGNKDCDVICRLKQSYGGATPVEVVSAATSGGSATLIADADWEQYTAKFTLPTMAGHTLGGNDSAMVLEFLMPKNLLFLIDFAQVQLEQSAVATEYETHSVLYEVARCERYFEVSAGLAGSTLSTVIPCYYFATRKYKGDFALTLVAGSAVDTATFTPLLDVGYYQSANNSVVASFFIMADAEIYIGT